MALNETLAARIRALVATVPGIAEKKMFGGLAFLLNGNMSVGVHGSELIVRIEPDATESCLQEPGVRIFDITGKPMKGWLLISSAALSQKKTLAAWVKRGLAYAGSLPAK